MPLQIPYTYNHVKCRKRRRLFSYRWKKQTLNLTSLGNSEGTKGKMLKAAVVEVKRINEIKNADIKGKIVFINIEMNPTYIRTFRAYGESGIGRRSGPAMAAKYGAVGVMVRSLASNEDDHPHTGTTVYNDSFPKIPAVAISTKNANDISKALAQGKIIKAVLKANCRMVGEANSFNVVGEIRGNKYPEQIVTVGGHLDSWDLAEGAQDDGTGCVQSIEIIRRS
ncbi:MAG: M28 family peptidase, partial [Ferruginibacter sp.]